MTLRSPRNKLFNSPILLVGHTTEGAVHTPLVHNPYMQSISFAQVEPTSPLEPEAWRIFELKHLTLESPIIPNLIHYI